MSQDAHFTCGSRMPSGVWATTMPCRTTAVRRASLSGFLIVTSVPGSLAASLLRVRSF